MMDRWDLDILFPVIRIKKGRPCTCIEKPLFVGDLLVTLFKVTASMYNTRVAVAVSFSCNEVGYDTKADHMSANSMLERFI